MNDELLIRFLLKETTTTENTLVQNWLAEAPGHASHYAQFEKIWEASKQPVNGVDEEAAWLRFKAKATTVPQQKPIVKPLKRNFTWLSIAAAIAIAIGSWSVYTLMGPSATTSLTSTNEILTKILPDGTELTINKYSQLSYAGNFEQNRNVQLTKGDVFFKVAHDQSHPFVIKIDEVNVQVVGTSFNIKHINSATEVIVETGIVKVSLGNQTINLVKGEKVLIGAGTQKLVKVPNQDQLYNYYRSKLFMANGTPLHKLVAILNEAYGSNVEVSKEAKNLTIYTTLPFESLDNNLEIIADALNLKISRNQRSILLSY